MAKMTRKDAAERISMMMNDFEIVNVENNGPYYVMTEAEYDDLLARILEDSTKELKEGIQKYSLKLGEEDLVQGSKVASIGTCTKVYARVMFKEEPKTEEPKTEEESKPRSKYAEVVKQLEELFDLFNEHFFNKEVEQPVIAVMHDSTKSAYGWCTTQKIWKSDTCEYYEINICAEHLNRPIKEVCATLIHEMVHLDNIKKEIHDTSAGGRYHNKKFKETAEKHGLVIERMQGYGWTKTSLSEEAAAWIDQNVKIEKFDIARATGAGRTGKGKSGSTHAKYNYYRCPCCGKKFYSIYQINATCEDCMEPFEQYK